MQHCKKCITNSHNNYTLSECQRYVCPNVISMTMNVADILQECIVENCFIEPYVQINDSLSFGKLKKNSILLKMCTLRTEIFLYFKKC